MAGTDKDTTVQELRDLVNTFKNERDWGKHHNPKDLAISISLEAAELLEHFQWDDYTQSNKDAMADELADIMAYCFHFAEEVGIDVSTVFRDKLARSAKKYPVEKFNKDRDRADDYAQIKKAYRQNK